MRSRSASRRAILFEQACDERWWKEYAEELEIPPAAQHLLSFRPAELAAGERTHTASFAKQEFIKTLVGDAL